MAMFSSTVLSSEISIEEKKGCDGLRDGMEDGENDGC